MTVQGQQIIYNDCSAFWKNRGITGHVQQKSAVPTKPRGIKATCIISGVGTTYVSSNCKHRKPGQWPVNKVSGSVCTCL